MESGEVSMFSGGGELGPRMSAFAWDRTPLGPVGGWPVALRTLVGIMLGAKQPMFAVWGAGLTLLYNDAYRAILGHKNADALGRSFLDVWAEARADLAPLVDRAYSGEPVHMDDITLMVDREGLDPEAHFAFSYTPIRDDSGEVRGFFCVCSETTEHVMAARRQTFRLDLEEALRNLDDAEAIIDVAVKSLGRHLRANRVGYAEVQPDNRTVVLSSAFADGVAPIVGTYDVDAFGKSTIEQQRKGRTVVVSDVLQRPDLDQKLWAGIETRAFVSVPILRAGRLAATLFVNQSSPRSWSRSDVALIESVGVRVSDAAQRLRAEHEARASEARFRSLMQALPNQVWTARPDGLLDWVNDRAIDYRGRTDPPLDGAAWTKLVHADDLELAGQRWSAALASGNVYEVEFRIRREDGVYRWHLVRAVPERSDAGAIARWIGTNTDIDDQKRAELDLVSAKRAAEEANMAKSTFIANMSHELRTPLSAIIGYSEMMAEEIADGCDVADLGPDMAKVENNARHLLGLINDVLDLSKIESGKMEVFAEVLDVATLLTDVSSTVTSLVGKKNNTLAFDAPADLGTMETDALKLRQMLLNLIGNAAKFTENGTITLRAARRTVDGIGQVVFSVSDTGIGMTEEQLAKLFQRFTQADSSTTRKFGGTGLGLSLTKAFAEMLGGEISVESAEGRGSTFTIVLPVTSPQPPQAEQPEGAEADATSDQDGTGDLILVIDDDPDQRTLMTRFLHREGFRVQVAADGEAGLALARSLSPRAILLDVMMPGVDGWSVLTAIKADDGLSDIPVVMVTSVDERKLAAQLGAADYMLKPVRWNRFADVMNRFRTPSSGILFIEDDPDIRSAIRVMLEGDGWVVVEASNGHEGVAAARIQRPEVVLLDLNMPVMDGFDFLDTFRTIPGCADTPVVVLTARELTRDDRRRLRGASQILNKGDISLRALVNRLQGLSTVAPPTPDGG